LIYITHDIDWLNPLHPYSVIKTFTHGKKWIKPAQLFNRNLFIEGIEQLLQFNQNRNTKSIWLIGAHDKHTFYHKGLRYRFGNRAYNNTLSILKESQVVFGLHSVSSESISQQCDRLTNVIGKPIDYHRSHYLNFNPTSLYPQLKKSSIKTDFSTGLSRNIYLPKHTPPIEGISITPTILFDNVFFFQPPEKVFEQFKQTLHDAKAEQSDVAVLFHPENFIINPALWEYYEEVLRLVRES
jgi:hypothetical protein